MSEVTLWMLTPTPVDPATSKPGIQAARYQAPVQRPAPSPSFASTPVPPSPPAQPSYSAQVGPSTSVSTPRVRTSATPSAPVQVASNTHAPRLRPNIKQLPHTASNLPFVLLVACLSLGLALLLSLRRLVRIG